MDKSLIRNFSIIAHIDHGKSTLSDRIIEMCGALSAREMKDQVLDSMELERERGITIKLNAVQLHYAADDGRTYLLHLIDTPGHVDFTYEVSRSLAACEGALLVVDASQGVEAQTLSNVYLALESNLEIMPVINKVDLPSADVDKTKREIEDALGLSAADAPLISAKTGLNVRQVLEALIRAFPAPRGSADQPLQALIFDSFYDSYKGVVCLVCIKNGVLRIGQRVTMMGTSATYLVSEVGVRTPNLVAKRELQAGEVGWFAAAIKTIKDVGVGDTVTDAAFPAAKALPGYKKALPMVFCGIYPVDNAKYRELQDAMAKISLSDAALTYQNETSQALGYGMRCGFLGLLHMDVIKERLEREYGLQLVATAPSVSYVVNLTDGRTITVDNPSRMPDRDVIASISEPYALVSVSTPEEYVGPLMELCQRRRGRQVDFVALGTSRRRLVYEMPLSEIMYSFFDRLKSLSRGYASLDYELADYKEGDLVKMDVLLNEEPVDALSTIVHRATAATRGKVLVERLREVIPRHQFEIPVQAAIGARVVARETIKAFRKNVLAKCYGGDVSRKKKLLEQQKEGKKRLKSVGSVSVPQEAFIAVLGDED